MAILREKGIIMIESEADVMPEQPWSEDGTADVVLKPSSNLSGIRNLPLKHFALGHIITIKKEDYPLGLVVVPTKGYPIESPKTLPCKISWESTIILKKEDWLKGAVGIFAEK